MATKKARCRGITDRRPQNSMEEALPQSTLPHSSLINNIVLEPDEDLAVWLRDLENYFPSLRVPHAKACRNAVGPPLSVAECVAAGLQVPPELQDRRRLYPALTTLSMGDLNALAHAQDGHETMVREGGVQELMRYGQPLPRGRLSVRCLC